MSPPSLLHLGRTLPCGTQWHHLATSCLQQFWLFECRGQTLELLLAVATVTKQGSQLGHDLQASLGVLLGALFRSTFSGLLVLLAVCSMHNHTERQVGLFLREGLICLGYTAWTGKGLLWLPFLRSSPGGWRLLEAGGIAPFQREGKVKWMQLGTQTHFLGTSWR